MNADLLSLIPLLTAVLVAAGIDARHRVIPNALTLGIVVAGLTNAIVWATPVGIVGSVLGLLTGFGLLLVPFALRAMGGGDVKLLAGIGAWIGAGPVLLVFVVAALTAMVIAIVQCAWNGRLTALFRNSTVLAVNFASYPHAGHDHVVATGQSMRGIDKPLPYAIPILVGLVFVLARSL